MPLIYAFVARGPTVLCDYTAFSGNFSTVAVQCLQKLPARQGTGDARFTYTCDGHTFNFVQAASGFTYLAVADEAFGRQVPFAVLERLKQDFETTCGAAAREAIAHSLQEQFGPRIRSHLQFAQEHPEELDKVGRVQQQVSEVKTIMMDNIEKVLGRGEKLELLVDKTDNLRYQANAFLHSGRNLRRKMWWQSLKVKLVLAVVILIVIFVIFLTACKGFKCVS
mmetsp:Transcript_13599/g.49449  ORF Transcript_13599/g.49449 Transcript_13599/m.49449 type:complete len:223 (+) Transcript_13599:255-923(+)|eukprot:scaffold618_cov372-Prasinococcus_capsulatus_cf.AAC.1